MRVAIFHSGRRWFTKDAVKKGCIPKNLYWGVYDLADQGEDLIELFPEKPSFLLGIRVPLTAWAKGFDKRTAIYRDAKAVFVTSKHSLWVVALDRVASFNRRLPPIVWIYAGYDEPWMGKLIRRIKNKIWFRVALFACDAICPETRLEVTDLIDRYPTYCSKFFFLPKGIDLDFYDKKKLGSAPKADVIVIGNNRYRDWDVVRQVARICPSISIRVLSGTDEAKKLDSEPNIFVHSDESLKSSRDYLSNSKILWVPTLPNSHFSGMTTVMMGMVASKPVVIDEELHWADFSLEPGKNCIVVARGDAAAAAAAIFALLSECERMLELGKRARKAVSGHGTEVSGAVLMQVISDIF